MDEVQVYAEFDGTASGTRIAIEESRYNPSDCVIWSGAQTIFLSVADARALIDGLNAFTEGPK